MQYGTEAYPKNAGAFGTLSESNNDAAKLSDEAINALPSGGDAGYDYYMLTSDTVDGSETESVIVRTQGAYTDLQGTFGLSPVQYCSNSYSVGVFPVFAECTDWTGGGNHLNVYPEGAGNDCGRWFTGYSGIMCYGDHHGSHAHQNNHHCLSRGYTCSETRSGYTDHQMRLNFKMYKYTGVPVHSDEAEQSQPPLPAEPAFGQLLTGGYVLTGSQARECPEGWSLILDEEECRRASESLSNNGECMGRSGAPSIDGYHTGDFRNCPPGCGYYFDSSAPVLCDHTWYSTSYELRGDWGVTGYGIICKSGAGLRVPATEPQYVR